MVEFGESGADAGAVGLGGGVAGQLFQFDHLGVLRGLDPGDPGAQSGLLGVAVGGGLGVAGGELGVAGGELGVAGGELGVAGGELGVAGGELGVAGGELGVAGGELGGEQGGAFGAEDAGGKELSDDLL